ncbi:MAG: AI-2E family transporter [Candidatus Marinimicrobia bacterium]|nr:AI-2E family transporter [Candidatus Neomarinimicrobiota bacterium]
MFLGNRPFTFDRTVRIVLTIVLWIGALWILNYLKSVLVPFVIATLLAYILNPTVEFIYRRVKNHTISIILTLIFYVSAITLVFWLVLPIVFQQFVEMGDLLSSLVKNSTLANEASQRLPSRLWIALNEFINETDLAELFQKDNFLSFAKEILSKVLPGFVGVLSGTANFIWGLLGLAVILLYLVFIMRDFQKFHEGWQNLIPGKYQHGVVSFVEDFNDGMKRYFRGQALIAGIVGILFALGFYIIDLPMGIVLGLFIGVLNMVPYLQTIGLIPAYLFAVLQALQTGSSFWLAILLVTIVFLIVQGTQDLYLVPKIMGKVTGFSPAIILLSLSIWGKLMGFFGLIIALPMTALLFAYYQRFLKMQNIVEEKDEDIKNPL